MSLQTLGAPGMYSEPGSVGIHAGTSIVCIRGALQQGLVWKTRVMYDHGRCFCCSARPEGTVLTAPVSSSDLCGARSAHCLPIARAQLTCSNLFSSTDSIVPSDDKPAKCSEAAAAQLFSSANSVCASESSTRVCYLYFLIQKIHTVLTVVTAVVCWLFCTAKDTWQVWQRQEMLLHRRRWWGPVGVSCKLLCDHC